MKRVLAAMAVWAFTTTAMALEFKETRIGRVKLVTRQFQLTPADKEACLAQVRGKTKPQAVWKCLLSVRLPSGFIFNEAYQQRDGDPLEGFYLQVNPDGLSFQFRGERRHESVHVVSVGSRLVRVHDLDRPPYVILMPPDQALREFERVLDNAVRRKKWFTITVLAIE